MPVYLVLWAVCCIRFMSRLATYSLLTVSWWQVLDFRRGGGEGGAVMPGHDESYSICCHLKSRCYSSKVSERVTKRELGMGRMSDLEQGLGILGPSVVCQMDTLDVVRMKLWVVEHSNRREESLESLVRVILGSLPPPLPPLSALGYGIVFFSDFMEVMNSTIRRCDGIERGGGRWRFRVTKPLSTGIRIECQCKSRARKAYAFTFNHRDPQHRVILIQSKVHLF